MLSFIAVVYKTEKGREIRNVQEFFLLLNERFCKILYYFLWGITLEFCVYNGVTG